MTTEIMDKPLSDVLWLGGGPDAGKSTTARMLSRQHGLRIYSLDKHGQAHLERLAVGSSVSAAEYRQVLKTSPVKRLTELSPTEHFGWTLAFARDRFPVLLEDLRTFEGPRPVLVEGVGLLPQLIKPLLVSIHQAIWLIPTEDFIVTNWARSKKRFLAGQTADPELARQHMVELDLLLAERIAAEAQANGLQVLKIDGSRFPAEVTDQVKEHFERHLPAALSPVAG